MINASTGATTGAPGPLRVHPTNPRYFSDQQGHAVYLTGSHTWDNFQDISPSDPPAPFDYLAYLRFLQEHGHNFFRLWTWEQATWMAGFPEAIHITPLPFRRTGPGLALDGKPKFDLGQWNPAYFERLRDRVAQASDHGFYVSVMLFNGFSVGAKGRKVGNPWRGHPFHKDNNINGIDCDRDGDGEGIECHTLADARVTAIQEAYARKVVDTLGDFDNVLWEISNESTAGSHEWQYHMIRRIKTYEARQSKQHPVGMTVEFPGENAPVWNSPADWISPKATPAEPYDDNPPPASGAKIVLSDTDHIWGIGGDPGWVWRSFFRGLYPAFMDPYRNVAAVVALGLADDVAPHLREQAEVSLLHEWELIRTNMGIARALAHRLPLDRMVPAGMITSTGYCLADQGREYVIYVPTRIHADDSPIKRTIKNWLEGKVSVDLSAAPGTFTAAWVNPASGEELPAGTIIGGRRHTVVSPFQGDAIFHLRLSGPEH